MFALLGLRGEIAALRGAHGGEPALELGLESGIVHCVRRMGPQLHGCGAVVVSRALHKVVEAFPTSCIWLLPYAICSQNCGLAPIGEAAESQDCGDEVLHCLGRPISPSAPAAPATSRL